MSRKFTPGKIVIHCPANSSGVYEFSDFWHLEPDSQIKDLFSGDNGNLLTLLCQNPSDYTPVSEGRGITIKDGWTYSKPLAGTKRLGFNLKIKDRRSDLRMAMEELLELHIDQRCENAKPITIHDYCYLKTREDRIRGYRARVGFFIDSLSGLSSNIVGGNRATCENPEIEITDPRDRYEAGFEFKFMEINKTSFY